MDSGSRWCFEECNPTNIKSALHSLISAILGHGYILLAERVHLFIEVGAAFFRRFGGRFELVQLQRKSTVGSLPLLRAACRRLDQSGCGPALLVLDAANTLGHLCSVLVLLEIRDSKAAAGEKLTKTKADASQGGSAQLCVCAMDFIVVKVGGVACAREPSITYYRAKTVKNASVTCAK